MTDAAKPEPGFYEQVRAQCRHLNPCIYPECNGGYSRCDRFADGLAAGMAIYDDLLRDAARVKQMERALGAAKDFIVLEELAPAEHVFEIHKRAEVRAKIYALIDAEIAREEKDSGHEK